MLATSSEMNGGVSGGFARTKSPSVATNVRGWVSTTFRKRSAQNSAASRWSRRQAIRWATRCRFSISDRRSMIGTAHSSPSVSGRVSW